MQYAYISTKAPLFLLFLFKANNTQNENDDLSAGGLNVVDKSACPAIKKSLISYT